MSTFLAMIFSMTMASGCGQNVTQLASKKAYRPPVVWKTLKTVKKSPSVLNQLRPVTKKSVRVEVPATFPVHRKEPTSRRKGRTDEQRVDSLEPGGPAKQGTWVPEPVPQPPHISPGLRLPAGGWGLGR